MVDIPEKKGREEMSQTSERVRKEWKIGDTKRDAGLTTPTDVERFDNLPYGEEPVWNLLDVYRPKNHPQKLPVIINIHGGGWVYGDKEVYQFYGMSLAQRGFAVVNFSYRLAPEAKFPAQLEDINKVVHWIFENEDNYGFDLNRIFMVGDSAGAHLCGLYSAICTNTEYAANYKFHVPESFRPKAIALNCGVYNPFGDGEVLGKDMDKDLMADLLPEKGSEKERRLINLTEHITSEFPPVYLMTAEGDYCRQQAGLLEDTLKKHGIGYRFKIYGTEEKPLYHVFHITIQETEGQKCNDEECEFFQKILD